MKHRQFPTPIELYMAVCGQGFGGGLAAAPVLVGLKEASVYYQLLKNNVVGLGGLGYNIYLFVLILMARVLNVLSGT
jgi:hypothetical protein